MLRAFTLALCATGAHASTETATMACTFGFWCIDDGHCREVVEAAEATALPWPPMAGDRAEMTVDWHEIEAEVLLRPSDNPRNVVLVGEKGPRDYRLRVLGLADNPAPGDYPARLLTAMRFIDNVDIFAGTCSFSLLETGN